MRTKTSRTNLPRKGGIKTRPQVNKTKQINVLLVEDSPTQASELKENLAKVTFPTFGVTHVLKLSEALRALRKRKFDLVLLDLNLPDSQEIETFRTVQAEASTVPIVVLTNVDDESIATESVREGAQDYLIKRETGHHLLARSLRYARERHEFQHEHERRQQEHLEQLKNELDALKQVVGAHGHTKEIAGRRVPSKNVDRRTAKRNLRKEDVTSRYADVVKRYLTQEKADPAAITVRAARNLFDNGLSGKEAVEIHLSAIDLLTKHLKPDLAGKVVVQARFFIIGVMTNLVDFYRGSRGNS